MTNAGSPTLVMNRRAFLGRSGLGLMALASLLNPGLVRSAITPKARWTGVVNPLHYPQRARRVIFLYMSGGPSHLETFDNKPQLAKLHGHPMPESFTKGPAGCPTAKPGTGLFCAAVCLFATRTVGPGNQRAVSAPRRCGRRPLHYPL